MTAPVQEAVRLPQNMVRPVIWKAAPRFLAKVIRADGCWAWNGATRYNGYGGLHLIEEDGHRTFAGAHRISYELNCGPIPKGMLVCHRCDNPPCCNPDHLFLGTVSDNAIDCANKNRNCKIGKSRNTHCPSGHPFGDNPRRRSDGSRMCRTCRNAYLRAYRKRKSAQNTEETL